MRFNEHFIRSLLDKKHVFMAYKFRAIKVFIGINKVIGPGIQIMETGIIEWAKIKLQKSKKKFKIDKKIKVFKHQGKIIRPYAQTY